MHCGKDVDVSKGEKSPHMVLWLASFPATIRASTGAPSPLCKRETVVIGPHLCADGPITLFCFIVTQQHHHRTFGRLENNDPILLLLATGRCHLGENHFFSRTKIYNKLRFTPCVR
jgi:hypothetical protein